MTMPKRKKCFTLEQHRKYGLPIKLTRDFLLHTYTELAHHYALNHKVVKAAYKAMDALDTLQCELDNLVCTENSYTPDEEVVNVYYGVRPWRRDEDKFFVFESGIEKLLEYLKANPDQVAEYD